MGDARVEGPVRVCLMLWVELGPEKTEVLKPTNVTLFANRVFADVIKLRRGH